VCQEKAGAFITPSSKSKVKKAKKKKISKKSKIQKLRKANGRELEKTQN
tara:strand:- start:150 stop:296 length:147 start_codon:yes stop_codon:yes gene_type:complete